VTGAALALLTGLLGSFGHCLGMCGPLSAAAALRAGNENPRAAFQAVASYQLGRVFTYGFLGALMGLSGSFVDSAGRLVGLQQLVGLLAGVFMVLTGLGFVSSAAWLQRLERAIAAPLMAALPSLERVGGRGRAFFTGLGLGFLPCGLSYSIFIGAAASGGPAQGWLYASAFGLGTTPALLGVGLAVGSIAPCWRARLHRLGGVAVMGRGVWLVVRTLRG
jgi:sulfite exporter TauE/SafE